MLRECVSLDHRTDGGKRFDSYNEEVVMPM